MPLYQRDTKTLCSPPSAPQHHVGSLASRPLQAFTALALRSHLSNTSILPTLFHLLAKDSADVWLGGGQHGLLSKVLVGRANQHLQLLSVCLCVRAAEGADWRKLLRSQLHVHLHVSLIYKITIIEIGYMTGGKVCHEITATCGINHDYCFMTSEQFCKLEG